MEFLVLCTKSLGCGVPQVVPVSSPPEFLPARTDAWICRVVGLPAAEDLLPHCPSDRGRSSFDWSVLNLAPKKKKKKIKGGSSDGCSLSEDWKWSTVLILTACVRFTEIDWLTIDGWLVDNWLVLNTQGKAQKVGGRKGGGEREYFKQVFILSVVSKCVPKNFFPFYTVQCILWTIKMCLLWFDLYLAAWFTLIWATRLIGHQELISNLTVDGSFIGLFSFNIQSVLRMRETSHCQMTKCWLSSACNCKIVADSYQLAVNRPSVEPNS